MSNAHVSRIEQRRRGGDRSIILGTNTVAEFDHTRQCHPPLIELSAEPLPKSCILENCIDGQFSFDGQANDHNFLNGLSKIPNDTVHNVVCTLTVYMSIQFVQRTVHTSEYLVAAVHM